MAGRPGAAPGSAGFGIRHAQAGARPAFFEFLETTGILFQVAR